MVTQLMALVLLFSSLFLIRDSGYNSNLELCKKYLLQTEKYSKLPKAQILISDEDLDNVRNEPWFIELLERLKAKEEADKVA
ncbi:hypothetical protein [Acinetobacter sp.]|uniref:hypothetical protein n=1 Tax=Acinetobacter sp. TaxID=472 RepID=UPI0035B482AA